MEDNPEEDNPEEDNPMEDNPTLLTNTDLKTLI
jgi:hypothetical protein